MTRVYPIFTDGKKFYHSSDNLNHKIKMRFAYFSTRDLKTWLKYELKTLSKNNAKQFFDSWRDKYAKK
jgi:hypothetical protein